jgi:NAD(P)-dependent dehydrogenase (short-subunit alcohol dehydrogenase family)
MKSVLITGTSSGIGRACALDLDAHGWRVFAGYRKDADGEALRAAGSERLITVRLDVTDAGQIAAAGQLVGETVGAEGLHGLVNNAGIPVAGPLEFVPIDDLRHQFEVNLIGQVAVIQAMLLHLRPAGGRIANMTSVGGRVASPFFGPYTASKFALEGLGDSLRRELHDSGIWVAAIEPGSIATQIWDKGQEMGNQLEAANGAEIERVYPGKLDRFREVARETGARGISPQAVADVVREMLTARKPKARYIVGRDAKQMIWAQRLLPARVFDAIVRRETGL